MVYLTFFCFVTLLIYTLFVYQEERKKSVKRRIASFGGVDRQQEEDPLEENKDVSLFKRLIYPVWREFKRGFKKRMPGEKEARIEVRLLQAGRPMNMTPVDFRLLQISLFITLPVLVGLYGYVLKLGLGGIVLLVLLGI